MPLLALALVSDGRAMDRRAGTIVCIGEDASSGTFDGGYVFGWLRRRRKPAFSATPKPQATEVHRFTHCTFCFDTSFYEGPSGGASQNIECAKCGARFNIGLIPGGPILLDELSPPTVEPYRGRYAKKESKP